MKTAKIAKAEEKLAYNIPELAKILGIGIPAARDLCHTADFPALKVGNRFLVPKQALENWLMAQVEKA